MSKHSIAGLARKARAEDKRLRRRLEESNKSWATRDSFQSFAAGLGLGTDNITSTGTYGFNPITRNHILLEWMYRGSWLAGVAVNVVADDMTRAGVDLRGDVDPEDIEHLERAAVTYNLWPQIADTVKWARLFGGCICVMLIDGQNPATPLRVETIGKGQFKGLMVLDRWMVEPDLTNLVTEYGPDLGLPKFYNVTADAPAIPRQKIHYSRVLRLVGIKQPYYQAMMENLWGISILERSFDRMLAFDSATSGVANLIYKAYLRTYGLKGLREAIAAGGPAEANVIKMVELMRRFQGIEGITLLDAEDVVGVMQQPSFAGLSDALLQIGQQLCGSWQIPQTRFFGVSPGGLNSTGESDMRMYYDGIKQQQMATLAVPVTRMYRTMAQSEGIKLPEGFAVDFRSLWVLSDEQKASIAGTDAGAVNTTFNSGIISPRTALQELRQLGKTTGRFTNISDEQIAAASDQTGAQLNEAMGMEQLDQLQNPPEEEAAPAPGGKGKAKKKAKAKNKDAAQMTKEEVNFEHPARGEDRCAKCKYFLGDACQLVKGEIAPEDWCEEFKRGTRDAMLGDREVAGLPVVIEHAAGDLRYGVALPAAYGYIRRTDSAEPGDQMDCFVGPTATDKIYIVDSYKPRGNFDEHKVMLNFASLEDAQAAFDAYYGPLSQRQGVVSEASDIKAWLASGDLRRPYAEQGAIH